MYVVTVYYDIVLIVWALYITTVVVAAAAAAVTAAVRLTRKLCYRKEDRAMRPIYNKQA